MLYHYVLAELVNKGKQSIFLAGGDYDYKRHYGSEEKTVYDCQIRRGIINNVYDKMVMFYRKIRKLV